MLSEKFEKNLKKKTQGKKFEKLFLEKGQVLRPKKMGGKTYHPNFLSFFA